MSTPVALGYPLPTLGKKAPPQRNYQAPWSLVTPILSQWSDQRKITLLLEATSTRMSQLLTIQVCHNTCSFEKKNQQCEQGQGLTNFFLLAQRLQGNVCHDFVK